MAAGRCGACCWGSVTAKLLHDLTVPVWTGSHLPDALRVGYKSVLAAVDGSDEAEVVMRRGRVLCEIPIRRGYRWSR